MTRLSQVATLLIAGCTTTAVPPRQTIPVTQVSDGAPAESTGQVDQGQAQPTTAAPQYQPQLPGEIPPIPTQQQETYTDGDQGQPTTDAGDEQGGQWVYTDQYGWIWMPYSDNYIYTPTYGTGYPYQYVYYPTYGWSWVVAPWVWGFGITPFFVLGGFHHHFFHENEFHEHFHGEHFRGEFHGEHFHGNHFQGGFRQPSGFHAPVGRTAPGRAGAPITGGHAMSGGHAMGGHPMGGPSMGGFHGGGGGFHGGGGGFHGGGGGFHGGGMGGGGFHGGGGGFGGGHGGGGGGHR